MTDARIATGQKVLPSLFYSCFFFTILCLLLSSCGNKFESDIQPRYEQVTAAMQTLKDKIEARKLSNIKLIISYAYQLKQQKPKLASAVDTLALEATIKSGMFQSLLQRLNTVNPNPENKHQYIPALQELAALQAATDPLVYNDSLQDVVNTLADLSGGSLARINVPRRNNSTMPGQYLVGNPTYGQWVPNSSGQSFWQWYGQYRFFSDITSMAFGRYQRPVYEYNSWHSRLHYSYYNDYGRSAYGSLSDRRASQRGNQRLSSQGIKKPAPAKNYASTASQKRVSTYASKQSSLASSLRAGQLPANNSSKTTSQSHKSSVSKRTSSFFGSRSSSSSRSGSSSRSSRGVRSGK